jgi:TDG/mug DNA glycosylase family protein
MIKPLRDYLRSGLFVVFCGLRPGGPGRTHYYSTTANAFWRLLHEAGFTPHKLAPEEDASVLQYGIGLTDINDDPAAFRAKIRRYKPGWVAFNGKAAAAAGLGIGRDALQFGQYSQHLFSSHVFILPSSSATNTRMPAKEKAKHWRALGRVKYTV